MRTLYVGIATGSLVVATILMIVYPSLRPTIEVLISLYLITNFMFIVCRGIYRTLRNKLHTAENTMRGMSWLSDLLQQTVYNLSSLSAYEMTRRQEEYIYPTIISVFIQQQSKNNSIAYCVLFLAVIAHIMFVFLLGLEMNIGVIISVLFIVLTLYINEIVLIYRIKHGFYGTNEYEVREILHFITNHADPSNFTTGQGLKDLLPPPIPEEAHRPERLPSIEGTQA
jgi:hypothetical protein